MSRVFPRLLRTLRPSVQVPNAKFAASRFHTSSIRLAPTVDFRRSIPIPEMSLTDFISKDWASFGDKIAFIEPTTNRTVRYSELEDRINSAANGLAAKGFKKGSTLLIHLPNCIEYFFIIHAASRLGGVISPCNPLYVAREIAYQLDDSNAMHVITAAPFLPQVQEGIAVSKKGTSGIGVSVLGQPDCFLETHKSDTTPSRVEVDHNSLFCLPYSSGTTGLPKGVMLSHRNIVANIAQITTDPEVGMGINKDDRVLALLPMFHIYGLVVCLHATILIGATAVVLPKFTPESFLESISVSKVSVALVAPPLVLFLAKHPMVADHDLSSLRLIFSGAAPLTPELQKEAIARTGCVVRQGYGMTEMSPVSHLVPASVNKPGSIGVTIGSTESRIVNPDTFQDVKQGEVGELWVKGPQVMLGYLNNDKANKETLVEGGWMRTGDIARQDEEGFFYMPDRLKELIKVKGEQVAPAELEGLLLEMPAIADAAVIPIDDAASGQVPKAFVVLKPGFDDVTAENVMEFVASQVAHYKHVKAVEFVTEVPKSASGKILRRILRDKEQAKSAK